MQAALILGLCTQGARCPSAFLEAAEAAASALAQYESTPRAETVWQGQEPSGLLKALGAEPGGSESLQECQAYNDDYQVRIHHQWQTSHPKSASHE